MCEGVRVCARVCEYVRGCTCVYEGVRVCTRVYEGVRGCASMCECIRTVRGNRSPKSREKVRSLPPSPRHQRGHQQSDTRVLDGPPQMGLHLPRVHHPRRPTLSVCGSRLHSVHPTEGTPARSGLGRPRGDDVLSETTTCSSVGGTHVPTLPRTTRVSTGPVRRSPDTSPRARP